MTKKKKQRTGLRSKTKMQQPKGTRNIKTPVKQGFRRSAANKKK